MGLLQKIFDANARILDKLDEMTVRDAFKKHANLRTVPIILAAVPLVGICLATETAANIIRRPINTSQLW